MKILLAVDGSEYSIKAARYLISHFNWFKESPELHILHVKAPTPDRYVRATLGHAAVENYYKEESQAALAPVENLLRENGIPFIGGYRVGEAAEQIHQYVNENGMDMIVMGSHGHGAFQSLIMGSVATKVLSTAGVPVLVVRDSAAPSGRSQGGA